MATALASCIYEGSVRHRRFSPVQQSFRQPLFMMFLDLGELPELFRQRRLWSASQGAWAAFRRRDHLLDHQGDHPGLKEQPLDEAVRDLVQKRLGHRPQGPVRLLTHMAYGGHRFNPVSFYYCYDECGSIQAVVTEINNTPWNEQHCYVLDVPEGRLDRARFEFDKAFHVSPFMPMEHKYRWRFTTPDRRLAVHMTNVNLGGDAVFDATLVLKRREITTLALGRILLRHPLMTVHVTAAIYWQAFRLWRKGCPYFPHPKHSTTDPNTVGLSP
jgi:DUF1365 family protein